MFPIGNIFIGYAKKNDFITEREHWNNMMIQSSEKIGRYIRNVRKKLGVTQKDLALAAGTGLRFIIDLENGKPTCQMGKTLQVLHVLGIELTVSHADFENENS